MTTLIVWTTIGLSASFVWCLGVGLFLAVGKGAVMAGRASRFVGSGADHLQKAIARDRNRIDRVAATALAGDHGTLHRPGDRMDLCPRCNPEVDARLLKAGLAIAPKKKRPRPASSKALKAKPE